jgi:hypothetical protein
VKPSRLCERSQDLIKVEQAPSPPQTDPVAAFARSYREAFAVLLVPAAINLIFVMIARAPGLEPGAR